MDARLVGPEWLLEDRVAGCVRQVQRKRRLGWTNKPSAKENLVRLMAVIDLYVEMDRRVRGRQPEEEAQGLRVWRNTPAQRSPICLAPATGVEPSAKCYAVGTGVRPNKGIDRMALFFD